MQQALVDERLQVVQIGVADFSAASSVQPPLKRERRAKSCCSSAESNRTTTDEGSQRLLAGIGVATALQQVEALGEAIEELFGGEDASRAAASSIASGRPSSR